jgi:hypothetical protein
VDDKFLHDARRDPRAEFAADLRDRLDSLGPARPERRPSPNRPWVPALGTALVFLLMVGLFAMPSVRASAQAFLDLFRVRNFAAVSVDPARLEQFRSGSVDLKALLGDHIETLREPGPLRVFPDAQSAGSAAGILVRVPAALPAGLTADTIAVQGEGEARLTADAAKLGEIMRGLGIEDLTVPSALEGARITIRMPAVVSIRYRGEGSRALLIQARSPEVALPDGVDLAQMGEIGLRIAGLDAGEARRFARSIDWHSTLLVPVPAGVSSFSEVGVRGNRGLLIRFSGEGGESSRPHRRESALMWSEGDMVYALVGDLDRLSLVEMAGSLQ